MPDSHTPGPWRVEDTEILAEHSYVIAEMVQGEQPDARLIATAPRMLDALEFIVRRLEEEGAHLSANEGRYMAQAWRMANEAIARAKGEA
jgi:hypothetical protein